MLSKRNEVDHEETWVRVRVIFVCLGMSILSIRPSATVIDGTRKAILTFLLYLLDYILNCSLFIKSDSTSMITLASWLSAICKRVPPIHFLNETFNPDASKHMRLLLRTGEYLI
jgi:hypothetical protein